MALTLKGNDVDPTQFDDITVAVAEGETRRTVLRRVFGGGLAAALAAIGIGAFGAGEAEAKSCQNKCKKKNTKKKRRRCRKRCKRNQPECTVDADCPAGQLCEDGQCIDEPDQCQNDGDCDDCETCTGGVCVGTCANGETCIGSGATASCCARPCGGPEPALMICCAGNETCVGEIPNQQCVVPPECVSNDACGNCEVCQEGVCVSTCGNGETCIGDGASASCCANDKTCGGPQPAVMICCAGNEECQGEIPNQQCVEVPTVVKVTPSNMNNWLGYDDETDVPDDTFLTFREGPGTPIRGTGSVEISVSGTQRRNIATYQFASTPLADITALNFTTYNPSAGNGGSANRSGYLHFNVDFDGSDTWQRRLVFLPQDNGTIIQDSWQEWDAVAGGNARWRYSGTQWPNTGESGETTKTWSAILAQYPGVRIRATDAFLGVRVGEPYNDGYTENISSLTLGTAAGTTIYDFEPDAASRRRRSNAKGRRRRR